MTAGGIPLIRTAYRWLRAFGCDPRQLARAIPGLRAYLRDLATYRRQACSVEWPLSFSEAYLTDRYEESGFASGHYFHQDLYVAREVYRANPCDHIDVGSRLDGFVAHLAVFRSVTVVDVRPLRTDDAGIRFFQADLTKLEEQGLPTADSVSCLHALEHVGLGRYGDTIDPSGWKRGLDALYRLTRPGGTLYVSVPISQHQRVVFNAHRIFRVETLLQHVQGRLALKAFAYVDDEGTLHQPPKTQFLTSEKLPPMTFGLGIFILTRPRQAEI